MSKKLIYKKGLLLKIVSWENDGDHYKTVEYPVDNLEEAKALTRMCKILFKSCNNGEGGIGNSDSSEKETIINFYNKDSYFKTIYLEDEFVDYVNDIHGELLGYSDYYSYRVCESASLYNIKEDVYLDIVKV